MTNAQVLCKVCHTEKSGDDIRRTRKADKQRDKASGAIKPAGKLRGPSFAQSPKPKRERPQLPARSLFRSAS
ncbi:hypothetical protein EFV37_29335 [Mesorhizobium loti]|uniref:Uncharacterized protein n=1 Tax=Mesorhizobium jarvisii TaxID=1777867 RepID=A0A6M7TRY5_9HYPH|nr:hypothetical protein EB229_29325 [Mesorhizobium jarvisii]QKD11821.1 hypothetical protein EFV37_29335 [Mesorhizobium loti]RJT37928.1 hypothetical protein D3242_01380 [Mesorhizobium jarvisii]